MYGVSARFGGARSYQNVDLSSRIEGASPHRLVAILFQEAIKAMDTLTVAIRRNDFTQRGARQARALAILHGLESSLDHERGGDIAKDLSRIYAEARRLTIGGCRDSDVQQIAAAREMLQEIASAWDSIG